MNKIFKKFDFYQEEIQRRNRNNFVKLTLGGSIICAFITFIGLFLSNYTEFVYEYSMFFIYMFCLYLLAKFCQRREIKHITLIYYLSVTPIMIGGILMGTFFDRNQPALTIMILINVLMLFVIDKPIRVLLYLGMVELGFVICCYLSKNQALFMADLIDLLIYGCIAIGINYFMLRTHGENVDNYCMVKYESQRDSLTRLYNRGYGEIKTRNYIEERVAGSFIIIDIDDFKSINDTYGHQIGDETICNIANILKSVFRNDDTIFRLGGDEFAIFSPTLIDENQCIERFEDIQDKAKHLKTSNSNCNKVGLSAGWTIYSGSNISFEDIYNSSDTCLYEVKEHGKGSYLIKKL